jgi:putative flippase GtrA
MINKRDYRFLFFGALNTGITFLVFSGLVLLGLHYALANILAWCIGVLLSFFFNARFVFNAQADLSSFFKFVASNLFSIFLNLLFLFIAVDIFKFDPIVSSLFSIPLIALSNYILFRFVAFKKLTATD